MILLLHPELGERFGDERERNMVRQQRWRTHFVTPSICDLPCCGRGKVGRPWPPYRAAQNQLVMLVGCVMAVPTTTAQAPASMAARASSGV